MMIVDDVQRHTIHRANDLKTHFENAHLVNFPEENVEDCCNKVDDLLAQLETEKQLPRDHLTALIDKLRLCSVQDLKIPFVGMKKDICDFYLKWKAKMLLPLLL